MAVILDCDGGIADMRDDVLTPEPTGREKSSQQQTWLFSFLQLASMAKFGTALADVTEISVTKLCQRHDKESH